jgi:hypothetical protein
MASEMVTLPAEAIADLRWALTHGLHAVGEVSRSQEAFAFHEQGGGLPEVMRDAMPLASLAQTDDITRFAQALIWLEHVRPVEV